MDKELKPFDKILVRNSNKGYWLPALYGIKSKDMKHYLTSAGWQEECIPYEDNEEYLGTNKDYVEPVEKNKAIKSDEDNARESLLDWLKKKRNNTMIPFSLREADRWIAWLEKQGEPTEINPSEFDLRLNKLLKRFEPLPKEEIASILNFYLNVIQNDGIYKEEKQGEQKPAEWSEEDDKIIKNLLSELTNLSVRNLIKQETEKKYANWLKSLRPQSQWKPTKEHLHTLEAVISDYTEQGLSYTKDSLNELYEQLKKLREE